MPYRVVEYTPPHHRHPARRPTPGRSPHMTVYYGGRSGGYGRPIPGAAHSRVVSVPPPRRFARSQDIYSLGDEAYRLPYRTKVVHIEDLSNYRDYDTESCTDLQLYEPEADIRRDASDVLMRLAYGLPVPLYSVKNIPLRSSSELRDIVDIRRRFVRDRNHLSSMSRVQSQIYRMAMYQEPMRKPLSGKVNLACLSFAGAKPISRRQLRYVPEDRDSSIRDLINFRSFYNNLRVAATLGTFYKKPATYQPLFKSKKSLLGIKDSEKKEKEPKDTESKWTKRAVEADYKPRAERAVEKPEIQQSYILPGPRKSVVEVPEEVKSFSEAEPEVVRKLSRKSIPDDAPIYEETKKKGKISPTPRDGHVEEEEAKTEEPEPEEVYEDVVEEKASMVEAELPPVPEPEPESEPVEEAIEGEPPGAETEILESIKPEEPEPAETEVEAVSPTDFEAEIEGGAETTEVEPEIEAIEAETELELEPVAEPVATPVSERGESREEQIASPLSEAESEDKDGGINGESEVNGEVDEEKLRSPPPTKVLSDEEADGEALEEHLNAWNGDGQEADQGVNGEAQAFADAVEDDFWGDGHETITRKYRRIEDLDDEDLSKDEPVVKEAEQGLGSECDESE